MFITLLNSFARNHSFAEKRLVFVKGGLSEASTGTGDEEAVPPKDDNPSAPNVAPSAPEVAASAQDARQNVAKGTATVGNKPTNDRVESRTLTPKKAEYYSRLTDKVLDKLKGNNKFSDGVLASIKVALGKRIVSSIKYKSEIVDANENTMVDEFVKNITIEGFSKLESIGGNGANAKKLKDRIMNGFLSNLEKGRKIDIAPYERAISLAYVADVLVAKGFDVKPSEIDTAFKKYAKPGAYTDGVEGKRAKDILDKIAELKDSFPGVDINYFGYTDRISYNLKTKDDAWYKDKADVFSRIIALGENLDCSLALNTKIKDTTVKALIEGYIRAENKAGYIEKSPYKKEFIKGGGIFDMATALQRAEDMKKRMEVTKDSEYVLNLTKNRRRSGLVLSANEVKSDYTFISKAAVAKKVADEKAEAKKAAEAEQKAAEAQKAAEREKKAATEKPPEAAPPKAPADTFGDSGGSEQRETGDEAKKLKDLEKKIIGKNGLNITLKESFKNGKKGFDVFDGKKVVTWVSILPDGKPLVINDKNSTYHVKINDDGEVSILKKNRGQKINNY